MLKHNRVCSFKETGCKYETVRKLLSFLKNNILANDIFTTNG